MDENSILTVTAKRDDDESHGGEIKIKADAGRWTEEQIEKLIEEANRFK